MTTFEAEKAELKPQVTHAEDVELNDEREQLDDEKTLIQKAKEANQLQHSLSVSEDFRLYWKGCLFSIIVSFCIVMEGYDIVLVNSMYALPSFVEKYGTYAEGIGYTIPVKWQNAIGNATTVGCFLGTVLNGFFLDRFGYRKTILGCLISCTGFIFIVYFAKDLGMLLAGEMLLGIPWGIIASMAPGYACEVLPSHLRGILAVVVDLAWIIGQLIAAGVMQSMSTQTGPRTYHLPFALQWMWTAPLLIGIWFTPESPWWLCKKGRYNDAEESLKRLTVKSNHDICSKTVAEIIHTLEVEEELETGSSYWECFKGVDLRRTEVVTLTYAAQELCGLAIGGTPTYFLFQAGISASNAYKFTVGILALGFVCVLVSSYLMTFIGRRTLYVWGLFWCDIILLVIGIMSASSSNSKVLMAQGGILFFWGLAFYLTLGPICFPIVAETSSMRLRAKSISLARNAYYLASIVIGVINPYMVNKSAWNWGGKTAFFYAGTCTVCLIWAYFRLPETKDRTPQELDLLFSSGISHRSFTDYDVDPFAPIGENLSLREHQRKKLFGFI